MYLRVFMSDCVDPWWYMVPADEPIQVLGRGGWAPPSVFSATRSAWLLYEDEVPLNELQRVFDPAEEAALRGLTLSGGIRVHVGGSADDRQGIAACCLISGESTESHVSLALPGMTGVDASELLGIVVGLLEIFSLRHVYSSAVLLTCSQFVITHVFLRVNPVGRRGQEVWPAIALARRIVDVFASVYLRRWYRLLRIWLLIWRGRRLSIAELAVGGQTKTAGPMMLHLRRYSIA